VPADYRNIIRMIADGLGKIALLRARTFAFIMGRPVLHKLLNTEYEQTAQPLRRYPVARRTHIRADMKVAFCSPTSRFLARTSDGSSLIRPQLEVHFGHDRVACLGREMITFREVRILLSEMYWLRIPRSPKVFCTYATIYWKVYIFGLRNSVPEDLSALILS
jgi:hypothetical protein